MKLIIVPDLYFIKIRLYLSRTWFKHSYDFIVSKNLTKLSDIIKNRKESILRNLQEADNKFKEASENLEFAKNQFEIAKTKAEQIRKQGFSIASQTSKKLIESVEEDIKRLKETSLSIMKIEEEKSIGEVVIY